MARLPPSTASMPMAMSRSACQVRSMHYRHLSTIGPHHSLSDRPSAASTRFPARPPERGAAAAKPQAARTPRGLSKIKQRRPTFACLIGARPGLSRLQSVDQDLGGRTGRRRVLPSDQEVILDRVDTPVLDLGIGGAEAK